VVLLGLLSIEIYDPVTKTRHQPNHKPTTNQAQTTTNQINHKPTTNQTPNLITNQPQALTGKAADALPGLLTAAASVAVGGSGAEGEVRDVKTLLLVEVRYVIGVQGLGCAGLGVRAWVCRVGGGFGLGLRLFVRLGRGLRFAGWWCARVGG